MGWIELGSKIEKVGLWVVCVFPYSDFPVIARLSNCQMAPHMDLIPHVLHWTYLQWGTGALKHQPHEMPSQFWTPIGAASANVNVFHTKCI